MVMRRYIWSGRADLAVIQQSLAPGASVYCLSFYILLNRLPELGYTPL